MTPSFIEELFIRIEERLNSLESQIQRMSVEITHLKEEMRKCYECREEIHSIKKYVWVGRGIVLAVWAVLITVVNVVIGRLIGNS